jgi:hypothetical protein
MQSKNFLQSYSILFFFFNFLLIFGLVFPALAQIPEGIPSEPNPLGLDSAVDYLLYIGLPLLILLLLTFWFNKSNGRRN